MLINKIVCDMCGKDMSGGYRATCREHHMFYGDQVLLDESQDIDLCNDCAELVKKFIFKNGDN